MTDTPPHRRVAGRFWRVLAPRWAHRPLSGEGAARNGGRFNPRGVPTLYLADELLTAFFEYEQDLGIRPGTFCAYEVAVEGVVDLTDPGILSALGVTGNVLRGAWKEIAFLQGHTPPTWTLASRLIADGARGALVPSVRREGSVNLVLWRWSDGEDVLALDPQTDLPFDQRSWSKPPPA